MASLATGSVNFPTSIYENPPALIDGLAEEMQRHNVKPEIEIFDLAMLYNSKSLSERGLLGARPHVQFVLGIKNALPARRSVLEFLLSELREVLPDATWTAAGIGRTQLEVNGWCLELGANALRTGLEDNIRFDKTRLAEGNADLVRRVAHLCVDAGRQVASPAEARAILNLPPTPPD
jgi:uncharacterized protein (DUF849 family)